VQPQTTPPLRCHAYLCQQEQQRHAELLDRDGICTRSFLVRLMAFMQQEALRELLKRLSSTDRARDCGTRRGCFVAAVRDSLLGEPRAKLLIEQPRVHCDGTRRSEKREWEEDSEGNDHVGVSAPKNRSEGEHCEHQP
jgi:hypothetical protein